MRSLVVLIIGLFVVAVAGGQEKPPKLNPRYNIEFSPENFPQGSPKEALESLLKAIDQKRIDYLLAHLAEPIFVDDRVKEVHKGSFEALVAETKTKLLDEPDTVKLLRRFAKEGDFETGDTTAAAKLKDQRERVLFKKWEVRWFFENKRRPADKN